MRRCGPSIFLLLTLSHLHSQALKLDQDPACQTLKPASTGGPLPQNPDILVLRYFSYGNFEVAYRGRVLLLDAFTGSEKLSELFEFDLEMFSDKDSLDPKDIIGKNITFSVDALNITDSLLKYYAANPTQVRAVYDNGTQLFAGVHVKF